MLGALSAEACATPAITRAKAIAADLIVLDLVMGAPFRLGWVEFESAPTVVQIRHGVDPMFMVFGLND
jgi:hypothetical protein